MFIEMIYDLVHGIYANIFSLFLFSHSEFVSLTRNMCLYAFIVLIYHMLWIVSRKYMNLIMHKLNQQS